MLPVACGTASAGVWLLTRGVPNAGGTRARAGLMGSTQAMDWISVEREYLLQSNVIPNIAQVVQEEGKNENKRAYSSDPRCL